MLNQIIEKYYSRVYAFALVHVVSEDIAKDLTQDVFLELAKRPQVLRNLDNVEAYVFTVVRHRTYQHFKKIHRNQDLKADIIRAHQEKYVEPELSIIAGDLEEKLQAFIDQLPDRQREIYRMRREKGMSYQEIADQLNISPHTVRNHLAEALKTIKVFLGREMGGKSLIFSWNRKKIVCVANTVSPNTIWYTSTVANGTHPLYPKSFQSLS